MTRFGETAVRSSYWGCYLESRRCGDGCPRVRLYSFARASGNAGSQVIQPRQEPWGKP